jgi:hypothetical protein
MVRLAILDRDGKTLTVKDLGSAAELTSVVEQARNIIRECERLADQLARAAGQAAAGRVPYS